MRTDCARFEERLADLLEGRADAETAQHVAACPACTDELARLRAMRSAFAHPWESAPADVIARLKGLMPSAPRRVARLLSPLGLVGARTVADDIQVVVGDRDVSLRLMVRRQDEGYTVMARLPEGGWRVERGGEVEHIGDRFRFLAEDLDATGFDLVCDDLRIEIPPLPRLMQDESEHPD